MPAQDTLQQRRQLCPHCQRALSACICNWVSPIISAVDVLILQHPMEAINAKNTARLLHLSLPCSTLEIGEVFAPDRLHALLHGPSRLPADDGDTTQAEQTVQPVLLYTDDHSTPSTSRFDARAMLVDGRDRPQRLRLVIVDGTWRKSRKMLFQNPVLLSLPRLALRDTPTSQYMIRKAHRSDQLSTLEAACYALMQLEKSSEKYHPLLTALDNFVVQQGLLRFRGQGNRRNE